MCHQNWCTEAKEQATQWNNERTLNSCAHVKTCYVFQQQMIQENSLFPPICVGVELSDKAVKARFCTFYAPTTKTWALFEQNRPHFEQADPTSSACWDNDQVRTSFSWIHIRMDSIKHKQTWPAQLRWDSIWCVILQKLAEWLTLHGFGFLLDKGLKSFHVSLHACSIKTDESDSKWAEAELLVHQHKFESFYEGNVKWCRFAFD